MDFELTQQQVMFRQAWREVLQRELVPIVDDAENNHTFPMEFYRKAGKLGYLFVGIPTEYGALGLGTLEQAIWSEELSRVNSGMVDIMEPPEECCHLILNHGSEEQIKKYVIPTIKGEKFGCFALTEPNAGCDPAGMETTAVRDGDSFVLNGRKMFITGSPVADYAAVFARTDKNVKPSKGISLILVDKDTPGFPPPHTLEKMGKHTAVVGEFTLQDCRVPVSNLVGELGRGLPYALGQLDASRIVSAAQSLGLAEVAQEAAIEYAKNRVQFGQPIGKFQAISFRLAHLAAEIESIRWLIYRAAWLKDQGIDCTKEASMVKLLAGELSQRVADAACQVHGGYGYIKEYPVERYFRDARAQTIASGTAEIMEMIIARQIGL